MAHYDVFVQGMFYKTMEAPFTNNILTQVSLDIADGMVPDYDDSKPPLVTIQPAPPPVPAPTSAKP